MDTHSEQNLLNEVAQAPEAIRQNIHETPVHTSRHLDKLSGNELFFKCESLQKTGSFKIRGVTNTIRQYSEKQLQKGIITHSSGNHAQAVAYGAQLAGIPAYIVMPENASRVKVEAVKAYGAEITFCGPTQHDRETTTERLIQETGALFIHPYDRPSIIAGQSTMVQELIKQVSGLDLIVVPIGGGGLCSGTLLGLLVNEEDIPVMGVEPVMADDARQSLQSGERQPARNLPTIADGLKTSLGELPFQIIKEHIEQIATVEEGAIADATRLIMERMKMVVEPSGAVTLAALLDSKFELRDQKIGVVISGGNVDLDQLP